MEEKEKRKQNVMEKERKFFKVHVVARSFHAPSSEEKKKSVFP